METNWKVDSMHSEVGFKVRHMMISNVSGSFGAFDASVATAGDDFSEIGRASCRERVSSPV